MKSALTFGLCAALLLGVPGCLKTNTKTVVNKDGTGTVAYDLSYKTDAIASLRERIDEMAERIDEQGGDLSRIEAQEEQLEKFVGSFSEAKVVQELKKRGFTVLSTKAIDKDGWKGLIVKAKFDDVNSVVALHASALQERTAGARRGGEGQRRGGRRGRGMGMRRMGRGDSSVMFIQGFETTSDPKIGKAILIPARPPRPDQGGDGEGRGRRRGGRGGGRMDELRSDLSLDEMKMTTTITLPGPIVEVVGCKKKDANQIVFDRGAAGMGQPSDEDRAARAKGVYATFRIPDGCKSKFHAPASKTKKKDNDSPADKKKKKKGGLGVDGDK